MSMTRFLKCRTGHLESARACHQQTDDATGGRVTVGAHTPGKQEQTLSQFTESEMKTYAGQSQDERIAARKHRKQKAQEQAGGSMVVEGTESDATRSSGQLSEKGKEVWRRGAGIDGGGKST